MIYALHNGARVVNMIDHKAAPLSEQHYLDALGGDSMMLEPATLEEIEATYLYGLAGRGEQAFTDAIVTTHQRIDRTMGAFNRALNQALTGTEIQAADAKVGDPKKAGDVAVLSAEIPLSDGQSIFVIFHSPSNDPGKITAADTLVAFRFLLNKRDVTHVVAPSKGRDISLKQTTMALANLAERNSTKFAAKQADNKAKAEELATLEADTEQHMKQAELLSEQVDTLADAKGSTDAELAKVNGQLASQIQRNEELRKTLAGLGKVAEPTPVVQPVTPGLVGEGETPKITISQHYDNAAAKRQQERASKTITGTGWKLINEQNPDRVMLVNEYQIVDGFGSTDEAEQWAKSHKRTAGEIGKMRAKTIDAVNVMAGWPKGSYGQDVFLSNPDDPATSERERKALTGLVDDIVYSVSIAGIETGINPTPRSYMTYLLSYYFELDRLQANQITDRMPLREKKGAPVRFDGAALIAGTYPKEKLIAALQADGGYYAPAAQPAQPTLTGNESKGALVTLQNRPQTGGKLGGMQVVNSTDKVIDVTPGTPGVAAKRYTWDGQGFKNRGQYLLTDGGTIPMEEVSKDTIKTDELPEDGIRYIKQQLSIHGQMTLTNGAVISRRYADASGDLEGYISIVEKDGTVYRIFSTSSQGGAMDDATSTLYKAYKSGKAAGYRLKEDNFERNRELIKNALAAFITGRLEKDWRSSFSELGEGGEGDPIVPVLMIDTPAIDEQFHDGFYIRANVGPDNEPTGSFAVLYGDGGPITGATEVRHWDEAKAAMEAAYQKDVAEAFAKRTPEPVQPTETVEEPTEATPLYWYGMRVRPYGLSTQPDGVVAHIPQDDVAGDPRVAELIKDRDPTGWRHGMIAYLEPLTKDQIDHYSLEDMAAAVWSPVSRAARLAELEEVVGRMVELEETDDEIWNELLKPSGSLVNSNNPFFVDGKYESGQLTQALQEAGYTGSVKAMANSMIDKARATAVQQEPSTGSAVPEAEAERLLDAMPFGSKTLNDYVDIELSGPEISAQMKAVYDIYGHMDAALRDAGYEFGKGSREHLAGYYLGVDEMTARDISNRQTSGLLPDKKTRVAVIAEGASMFDAGKLVRGEYPQSEIMDALSKLGGKTLAPTPDPTPEPALPGDEPPATSNQWDEADPAILALLEQLEALRTGEGDYQVYLEGMGSLIEQLEQAGAVERHEPYLHKVADRLTELMEEAA